MTDCNKVIKDIEYAKDLLQNRPEQDTVDYKVYEVLDDALDLIHDLRSQIAMLVAAQHIMAEIMDEMKPANELKAQWIYLQHCANEGVYCSNCHTRMFDRYPMKNKLSHFCGRCGARMEAEVQIK